ncbi:hypothetical protein [Mycoplasma putrefaciens]|nr:hypothetical protein [Mycoplasma putrefaciens]
MTRPLLKASSVTKKYKLTHPKNLSIVKSLINNESSVNLGNVN